MIPETPAHLKAKDSADSATRRNSSLKSELAMGVLSRLAAISCCVSPVVLVLLGVATAAEAVSLGETLYYTYG